MARVIPRKELRIFSDKELPDPEFNYQQGAAFLVHKPIDWSSFGVVKVLRAIVNVKKVGHAGTLDPAAEGLLVICCGRATKTISQFQDLPKTYIAEITFGASTPSYDAETEISETKSWEHITRTGIEEKLQNSFSGTIQQKPPLYSAIKKNGERLYKIARRGEKTDVGMRWVTIHQTEILAWNPPILKLKVICGKGTYIRSLAHDLGKELNSGAYLSGLKRTAIGEYRDVDALTVEQLRKLNF